MVFLRTQILLRSPTDFCSHLQFAATAEFIGEVDYRMSLPDNPFSFGNDISQYQQKVKDFYTVGYNRRDPSAHPKGAYRRPGQYANVVWNGQDGRQSTICPLTIAPGAIKKRGSPNPLADSELESPDICANYTDSYSVTSRALTAHTVTITPSSTLTTASTSSSPPLACTQYFYFPEAGPNSFVCQCNDDTWNHFDGSEYQDSYSECPSQVAIVSLTAATASATVSPRRLMRQCCIGTHFRKLRLLLRMLQQPFLPGRMPRIRLRGHDNPHS